MKPEDFGEEVMPSATRHSPDAVRLPSRLVEKLKIAAERQGKSEYQSAKRARERRSMPTEYIVRVA